MVVISIIVLVTLVGLSLVFYSSRVQNSVRYQATVVPLANIMDIGFVAMTPIIVIITGLDAAVTMLSLCALGYAMGWVMRYNIRRFEPVSDEQGALYNISRFAKGALIVASLVNIAYYLQLMGTVLIAVIQLPVGLVGGVVSETGIAVISLISLGVIGYFFGLEKLNALGEKTTAFNLAAITTIIVGFVAYNIQVAVAGEWMLPDYDPPLTVQGARQILGFFAIVQGFEASRYLGSQYSAELRIQTMRSAQIIATVAFVLFPLSSLLLFAEVHPEVAPIAAVQISVIASPVLPWLILALALGSQASAAVNALSSRSEVLMELLNNEMSRRATFPVLAMGTISVVLVTDVFSAVAVASRVFATYFALQCLIALVLAGRHKQRTQIVGISMVGLGMLTIAIFGLPS